MPVGRQVSREATIYLVGFVGAGLVQLLAVPIYTRTLGPERYGYLVLTVAATTVLAGIMVVGGDVALARHWSDATTERAKRELATTWISFLTLWSVVVAAVACLLAPRVADAVGRGTEVTVILIIGVIALIPAQLSRMLAQILRNRFSPVPYAYTTVLTAIVNVAFGVLLGVVFRLGVAGILLGTLIGETLGALVRLMMVRRSLVWSFTPRLLPPLLRFALPLVPASIATWVFTGADRLVIAKTASPVDLGGYGLAATLVAPFTVTTLALGQAWIPRVTTLHAHSRSQAVQATSRGFMLALCGLGIAAICVGVMAPWLILAIGGKGYDTGASALPFLALGAAFYGSAAFAGTGLTLEKHTWPLLISTVSAAVVDILLLFALVPRWGASGAAAAVATSYLLLLSVTYLFSNSVFPLEVDKAGLLLILVILVAQQGLTTLRGTSWMTLLGGCLAIAAIGKVGWSSIRPVRPRRAEQLVNE